MNGKNSEKKGITGFSRTKPKRRPSAAEAARIEAIFARLARANPDPRSELHYSSPFTLLVAVVLSAQATDVSVNKATPALFALADTPEKMSALTEEQVCETIKSIGLYRAKAKNILALSRLLVERHGGEAPRTLDKKNLRVEPGTFLEAEVPARILENIKQKLIPTE